MWHLDSPISPSQRNGANVDRCRNSKAVTRGAQGYDELAPVKNEVLDKARHTSRSLWADKRLSEDVQTLSLSRGDPGGSLLRHWPKIITS
jgi:hypothetical protein